MHVLTLMHTAQYVFLIRRKKENSIDSTSSEFSMHLIDSREMCLMRHKRRPYPGERITHAYLQTTSNPWIVSHNGFLLQWDELAETRAPKWKTWAEWILWGCLSCWHKQCFDSFWWDKFPVCLLAWLVAPPAPLHRKLYYLQHLLAECRDKISSATVSGQKSFPAAVCICVCHHPRLTHQIIFRR